MEWGFHFNFPEKFSNVQSFCSAPKRSSNNQGIFISSRSRSASQSSGWCDRGCVGGTPPATTRSWAPSRYWFGTWWATKCYRCSANMQRDLQAEISIQTFGWWTFSQIRIQNLWFFSIGINGLWGISQESSQDVGRVWLISKKTSRSQGYLIIFGVRWKIPATKNPNHQPTGCDVETSLQWFGDVCWTSSTWHCPSIAYRGIESSGYFDEDYTKRVSGIIQGREPPHRETIRFSSWRLWLAEVTSHCRQGLGNV